jgi:hypothetical protein
MSPELLSRKRPVEVICRTRPQLVFDAWTYIFIRLCKIRGTNYVLLCAQILIVRVASTPVDLTSPISIFAKKKANKANTMAE